MARSPISVTEKFFLALFLIVGLALVFITPPFQAPDEYAHFCRAYALSELDFTSVRRDFPVSFETAGLPVKKLPAHQEERIYARDLLPAWQVRLSPETAREIYFGSATAYPPLIYLPQTLGIAFGRMLGFGPLGLMTAGRLFNLVFAGLLGLLTLRLLPAYKWLFASLLLMPMLVFLSASLSPDALTDSLCLLMIAYVLRLTSNKVEQITWRETAWLVLLCGLVAATKVPYFMLSLVLFLIPHQKFGAWKEYFLKAGLVFGTVLLVIIITQVPALISGNKLHDFGMVPGATPSSKFQELIRTPQIFFSMLSPTLSIYYYDVYLKGYIGFLGWSDTRLPRLLYSTYLLVPLALALVEWNPGLKLKALQRALLVALTVAIILILHMLLYISYTPFNSLTILGVQGRYFIPLGPLLFMAFAGLIQNDRLCRWLPVGAAVYLLAALLLTVRAVILRYYIGL